MSEKQSCAADIVYKQIDGGWHQYTVSLRPGQNYSWKDILADADSIAAADLSPIVNVQLMTAAGKAKELTAAYKNSGSRFSKNGGADSGRGKNVQHCGSEQIAGLPDHNNVVQPALRPRDHHEGIMRLRSDPQICQNRRQGKV